ncbi:MAG: tetratricopeptide repeat protein [Bacillota bacterium]|nr:tetratricopeptide repeat protein [Bacillota bacterium]
MSLYLTDDEQLNLIKCWFKKYGKLLIVSVTVLSVTLLGLYFWQEYKDKQTENTSILYEQLLASIKSKQPIDYDKKMPNNAYGHLSALLQAKAAIQQGNFDAAMNNLTWVIQHTQDVGLKQISRIRLARVLLAQNKPELALKQINIIYDATFNPLINKVRARILIALDKKPEQS